MGHKGFKYDFTLKELRYFLLGDRRCPFCRQVMERKKKWETVFGEDLNSKTDMFFAQNAKVKHYYYVYQCYNCSREFLLKDLANRKGYEK